LPKNVHEIRDPIHVFIRVDSDERKVIDSRPFQRLRHIHQLALTYLVYPGATHRRFEHSLGVMELAGRVFDVITRPDGVNDEIRDFLPEVASEDKRRYWRRVLRMAALCHDIGHLPFSHAAEKELLPPGWNHERFTVELINSPEMLKIWNEMNPPLRPIDLVKIAVGPKELPTQTFSPWETLVAEIVVGDAFGVDRIDYLLRDSYHSGVAYGKFDHHRLIDTLRILPYSPAPPAKGRVSAGEELHSSLSRRPMLGIEHGGLQSVEALALARYFMYSQLYFHPVRRIYDIHLKQFLQAWLKNGKFSTQPSDLLRITDNEVTAGMLAAAFESKKPGHLAAKRLVTRNHFRVLYQPSLFTVLKRSTHSIASKC
jgi:uncharacterized protein